MDRTLPSLDYNLRAEYLLTYDAEDASGNTAETVKYSMTFVDKSIKSE